MNNSAENFQPEDVDSRSSTFESVDKEVVNPGNISDASGHYNNAGFGHFIEEYTARVTEAGAEFWKNMPDADRSFFSKYGFGENNRSKQGAIGGGPSEPRVMQYPVLKKACNTSKRRACPKTKKSCAKPKTKVAKRCAKPKPKKMCAKPKRKAKKMCAKPKRKPVCPRPVKVKCPKPYPGGQTSVLGMANKRPDAPVKEGHIKENK